ncbi:hypothetical protein ACWCWD_06575 [Streptomyces sp. NPDC001493]
MTDLAIQILIGALVLAAVAALVLIGQRDDRRRREYRTGTGPWAISGHGHHLQHHHDTTRGTR